ncbi:unnamed protein product [marine sediment metagenome]|uniref:Uncharacterized protein n=1 Tax=marine sediment metagenome TaxID=412755 RepID=X1REH8_9ZZZZ
MKTKHLLILLLVIPLLLIAGYAYTERWDSGWPGPISDTAYDESTWNGVTDIGASKNALRDKIESIGTATISDTAYDGTSWNGVTTIGASKNAIRDQFEIVCLESVFGTSIGTGMLLDTGALKVSAILQKYHAIDPSANMQIFLANATFALMRADLDHD